MTEEEDNRPVVLVVGTLQRYRDYTNGRRDEQALKRFVHIIEPTQLQGFCFAPGEGHQLVDLSYGDARFEDSLVMARTLFHSSERPPLPDANAEWPRYNMVINGKSEWLTLKRAGIAFDSGWMPVKIGGQVLLEDGTVRDITRLERQRISDIAEEWSADK